jgi:hypothetical protein
MMTNKMIVSSARETTSETYLKDVLVSGKPSKIECVQLGGQTYSISRGAVTVVALEDEWYEDVQDPAAIIDTLRANANVNADLFTFWQRFPDVVPKYSFHQECEQIAVLPIRSLEHWFSHQIKSRVRTSVRKAEKEGLVVKETTFDDDFVRGMTSIFNEAPIRQGRPFWHYGKDFETIKRQFSRYLYREHMIGAYYQGEMIGFIMLGHAGRFGLTGQIISSIKHRDKATNISLIAAAVEACAKRNLEYLVYLFWSEDSLSEFKRRCGFEKIGVPRYYVPQTMKGRLALKAGFHRGFSAMLPSRIKTPLKQLRRRWYERREN